MLLLTYTTGADAPRSTPHPAIHHREDVPHPDVLLPRHRDRVARVCLPRESGAYVAVSILLVTFEIFSCDASVFVRSFFLS
jgi:hypothetical protein